MENASKASIHLRNLRDLRENYLKFMALQGICKSFNSEVRRNTQSSQIFILRRFALMRTQSLATLFLRLCFSHLKSSYIRGTITKKPRQKAGLHSQHTYNYLFTLADSFLAPVAEFFAGAVEAILVGSIFRYLPSLS